ncbi:response regulator [Streptomyces sp. V4-01]|uniref:Response regulator n=1 Tax=Actinacidiphila polyblastidii TaxID=3110430 RepID=A0ABU7PHH6_9ACTN|nr:response regulator [Streptomyces sp. V4-01]
MIITSETGGEEPLTAAPAAVLLRLLFAKGRTVAADSMRGLLPRADGADAVHAAVSTVRRALKGHGVALDAQRNGAYRLPAGAVWLDASEFAAEVGRLPPDASAAELTGLLAWWRGDPITIHPGVDERHWRPALRARLDLVERVAALFRAGTQVDGWLDFAEQFSGVDEAVRRVDLLDPARLPLRRRRLLIVEDSAPLGRELAQLFTEMGYETTLAPARGEALAELERERFDAALVDRHLTRDNDDNDGYVVLQRLQELGVPSTLLTAFLPGGDPREKARMLEDKFGLAGVCTKGDGFLPDAVKAVQGMMRG